MNTNIPKMRTIKETAKETGLAYNYWCGIKKVDILFSRIS